MEINWGNFGILPGANSGQQKATDKTNQILKSYKMLVGSTVYALACLLIVHYSLCGYCVQ